MGQQQLLLLVLAVVIVGMAIVVGIYTFSENSIKSNYDTILQETLKIANDLQTWQQRPELFGGSPDINKGTANIFLGASFIALGYDEAAMTATCYHTLNGTYSIATTGPTVNVVGTNANHQNMVQVSVTGSRADDILLCGGSSASPLTPVQGNCARGNRDIVDGSDFGGVADAC